MNLKVVIGIVGIAISFIIFPVVLDGAVTILQSGISSYSGLESVVKISPLIIFVGMLFGSGMSIWSGTDMTKRVKKSYKRKRSPVARF